MHKKKSLRIYTSMHSGGLELTKLTYSRHEDNLLLHRGDRTLLYNTLVVLTSIHSLVNRQERVFFSFLSSLSTFDDLPFCCLSPKAISFGRICDQWYHEERKKERVFFSFLSSISTFGLPFCCLWPKAIQGFCEQSVSSVFNTEVLLIDHKMAGGLHLFSDPRFLT